MLCLAIFQCHTSGIYYNYVGTNYLSTRSIQFENMHISEFRRQNNALEITFDYAVIIKNMDAAIEESRWYGAGIIRVEELLDDGFELPDPPIALSGADVCDNQMTYRNEVAIPFAYHGHVGLKLTFVGFSQPVSIFGEKMSLELSGHEKYIEHIKAE